jgi:hypothetical protein
VYVPFEVRKWNINNVINSLIMEWIDIKESLPKKTIGIYLVCLKNNGIFIANYSNLSDRGFWQNWGGDFVTDNPITHWAELPKGANEVI